MKNRGVFITIILILVLGAGITFRMHQFVTENTVSSVSMEQEAAMEVPEEAAVEAEGFAVSAAAADLGSSMGRQSGSTPAAGRMMPETAASENRRDGEAGKQKTSADTDEGADTENAVEEAWSEASVSAQTGKPAEGEDLSVNSADGDAAVEEEAEEDRVLSPLAAAPGGSASEETLTAADYQKKLEDVDRIVKELRETDATANTTDSVKNIAEYEYRLWDTELNRIYQAVISAMSESEAERLRSEERQWIRSRDQMAKQAAAKLKGGTMESLEYTASLSVSTRERAYELLEDYGDVLSPKEKKE